MTTYLKLAATLATSPPSFCFAGGDQSRYPHQRSPLRRLHAGVDHLGRRTKPCHSQL